MRGRVVAAAISLAIGVAACGGEEVSSSRATDGSLGAVIVEGCQGAWTELADLSPGRSVARCQPGAPAAVPLEPPAAIVVALPARLEFAAPVLLADALGEFAEENLSVRFVDLPASDTMQQLADGQVDAALSAFEVGFFDAAHAGAGVEAVMGNYFPPEAGNYDVPQTGLWCRRSAFSDPANPDPAESQDLRWAMATDKASVSFYYSIAELRKRVPDIDAGRIQAVVVPPPEIPAALRSDAADCGVLLDPLWIDIADEDYVQIATQTPGEPLGFVQFGRNLLQERPGVGDAFVRAVIRTINTYLSGNYREDDSVMAALSEAIGQPVSSIARTPALVFDWELRSGTAVRIQDVFIDVGAITAFDQPIAEGDLIDRSFSDRAVGRPG